MEAYPLLFSPLQVGPLKLRNRIVMPAMHLNYTFSGAVSDQLIEFYRERAAGGAGLIIIGGCAIDDLAGGPIFISIKKDEDIPGLAKLAEAIHAEGAALGAQLYMAGSYAHSALIGQQAISSSTHISGFTREEARPMSLAEIAQVQDDFAAAALRAKKAGLDMVEILGSAGYLICQFLSPKINCREDEYGGSLENRMRFGLETVAKVRAAVGPDFCVGIRIAGNDFVPGSNTNKEAALFAAQCEKAGVDLINVTGGWHETKVPQITGELPSGGFSYLSRGVRRAVGGVPVACSNRIHTPDLAEDILARGDADLVCLGRPLLADPDFPAKAEAGRSELIMQCVACNQGCFDAIPAMKPVGCLVNPRAGREALRPRPTKTEKPQKVVVIGGGPAGAMAAITAAQAGHRVTLFEAEGRLGGQPAWYAQAVDRPAFATIPAWQAAHLAELGVEIRLGSRAGVAEVAALKPDKVILACGGRSLRPDIPGADRANVCTAWQILQGQVRPRGRVVVIGGGAVGLETALAVARKGALSPEQTYYLTLFQAETPEVIDALIADSSHEVSVLETLPKIGRGIGRSTRWITFGLLKRFGIPCHTKAEVVAITDEGVDYNQGGERKSLPAETVVLAVGFEPVNELAEELAAAGLAVEVIGDAAKGGSVLEAIRQGFDAGLIG